MLSFVSPYASALAEALVSANLSVIEFYQSVDAIVVAVAAVLCLLAIAFFVVVQRFIRRENATASTPPSLSCFSAVKYYSGPRRHITKLSSVLGCTSDIVHRPDGGRVVVLVNVDYMPRQFDRIKLKKSARAESTTTVASATVENCQPSSALKSPRYSSPPVIEHSFRLTYTRHGLPKEQRHAEALVITKNWKKLYVEKKKKKKKKPRTKTIRWTDKHSVSMNDKRCDKSMVRNVEKNLSHHGIEQWRNLRAVLCEMSGRGDVQIYTKYMSSEYIVCVFICLAILPSRVS